jgi:uncharacterized membrane protein (UPF0136 family)
MYDMPMKQSQLKLLSELLADSDSSVKLDLSKDTLIIKIQRNEIYIVIALIGLLFSGILLYFRKNSDINFELGVFALVLSITTLMQKQTANKTLIFSSNTNSLAIIPSFFLNKWFLKALIKTNHPISFNKISEIKISYGFLNNQSKWTLSFKERFSFISLLSFTDKEKARQICDLLNEMRA